MRIVIVGAGEVGSHLAKMLRSENNNVTVIDNDPHRIAELTSWTDVNTVCGNLTSIKVLREAGTAKADLFIGVCPGATQEINLVCCIIAKRLGAGKVIARIKDEDYLTKENRQLFRELGIDLIFYPEKSAANAILNYLRHNSSSDVLEFAKGKLQIAVYRLNEESPMVDMRFSEYIKSLTADDLRKFRLIAVSRNGKAIIPKLNTHFKFADLVFTMYKQEDAADIDRLFGKNNIAIRRVFIIGGSPIAEILAALLDRNGLEVKLVEKDKDRCIELSEKLPDNVDIVCGDGRNSDFLLEENIQRYDAFVALSNNDESNVLSCVVAHKFGVARTVAEVENIEYVRLAEEMGVDNVINKKLLSAGRIFRLTLSNGPRIVRYMAGTDTEVMEYTVPKGSAITKAAIKDINFPKDAIIGGVVRGDDAFIAVGDSRIEPGDRVAVFTLPESLKEIDELFKSRF